MIEQQSLDGNGWALFSDDMKMRFRLARAIDPTQGLVYQRSDTVEGQRLRSLAEGRLWIRGCVGAERMRIVFLMLNPSVADAFKPDRTVSRCIEFARRWGAGIVEVVNLFALISTDPDGLLEYGRWQRGDDVSNDDAIVAACRGATRVIAAWGNGGGVGERDVEVRRLLEQHGIRLETFRLTKEGYPTHPLARGKSWVPYDLEPIEWTYVAETTGVTAP